MSTKISPDGSGNFGQGGVEPTTCERRRSNDAIVIATAIILSRRISHDPRGKSNHALRQLSDHGAIPRVSQRTAGSLSRVFAYGVGICFADFAFLNMIFRCRSM